MKKQSVFTILLILTLASASLAFFDGDKKPWCKFPSFFPGTLKASPAFIDVTKDLNGDWYTVGYKKQRWDHHCQCGMQNFQWNAERNRLDTWFGCSTRRDQMYTDVTLKPKNDNNSKFGGWMRFRPDGWFWVPFNFWILDIASDKSWFLIGEPCRTMAFLVSRTRSVDANLYTALKQRLVSKFRFDVSDFIPKCDQGDLSQN